jgi:hypothetical protein
MRNRTRIQTAPPGPTGTGLPPAAHNQPGESDGHDGRPNDNDEAGLDAYVARLVAAAPPLSGRQRDTLALLLRFPRGTRRSP